MNNATCNKLIAEAPRLTIAQRRIASQNEFQFYVLYGTQPGPWVKIGLNDTEYLVGFLPQPTKRRHVKNTTVVSASQA